MKDLHIILDPGHGLNGLGTSGKCSPVLDSKEWSLQHPYVYEKRYREGNSNRDIVRKLTVKLEALGYTVHNTNPEDREMGLPVRVMRANKVCSKYGAKNCLFISVHSNAAPAKDGGWTTATGFSVYVAKQCSENSRRCAQYIYDLACKRGFKGNRSKPSKGYWEANFYVIKNTACPAILTENLFYNNKEDLHRLMDVNEIEKIVQYHLDTITYYEQTIYKRK